MKLPSTPWSLGELTTIRGDDDMPPMYAQAVIGEDTAQVAVAYGWSVDDAQTIAFLIAGAPELLAALGMMVQSVSIAGTPMKGVDMREVGGVAMDALRKAVGED